MKENVDFKQILLDLLPRLRRYALTLASNEFEADDLLQATVERALTKCHQFRFGDVPDRWLFSVMSSVWKNELRAKAIRQGKGFVDPHTLGHASFDSHPEKNAQYRETLRKVGSLPEIQRQVILLVYVEGFKYAEAAEILDVPLGTVMSRLSRARLALSALLDSTDAAATGEVR